MKKTFKLLSLIFICISNTCIAFTWPVGTPESQGIDSTAIDRTTQLIQSRQYGNIRSLLVIRNGVLVHEKYFGNLGEKRPVYSVTKSVGSVLLGIAQEQGAALDVNDSMYDYMSRYNNISFDLQHRNISIHNLLTQRHGLDWDEWSTSFSNPSNPMYQVIRTQDWYKTVLKWPLITSPDNDFTYSTGASSLMSVILEDLSGGMKTHAFAKQKLFEPLSITDTHWELVNDYGQQGQGIRRFPHNLEPLGYGLWLKPYDMAKIGELYLKGGIWQGQRLVSQEWIDQSIIPYSNEITDPDVWTQENSGYGYQWWVTVFIDNLGREHKSYYADGYGRQYIFVFPESDTVIVTTADDYNRDGQGIGTLLRNNLLSAIEFDDEFVDISNDMNGSWYDPEQSGQGINIEIINAGQTLWGYWYTFNESGSEQRWFTMQGQVGLDENSDTATFEIISTEGGVFLNDQTPSVTRWGQGTIQFNDCFTGKFTFEADNESVSGEIPLTRLTAAGACDSNNKTQPRLHNKKQKRAWVE